MTWVSVPPAAVTVMPAAGSASVAPFAGVIVTRGPAAAVAARPRPRPRRGAGLAGAVPAARASRRQQGQRRHRGQARHLPY